MNSIKLIHIGDVHYPDKANMHLRDLKDRNIDEDFVNNITPNPFQRVSKEIISLLESENVKGILLSGDLTSRGDIDSYGKCVTHFLDLCKGAGVKLSELELHVVPGNHDIDRSKALSGKTDDKFEKFIQAWEVDGEKYLKPSDVRQTNISEGNAKLRIYSLNTCVGCGEVRGYPEKIRECIEIDMKNSDLREKDDFKVYGEQLDTPAVNASHIEDIEHSIIVGSDENEVPVILAHHGVLPQSTTRVDIYTEMINGGYVRSVFNSVSCSVLYCHGHIHTDPVEVLSMPKYDGSSLISVSAPEFIEGFNLVEIHYSAMGYPLGCTVKPFRMQHSGTIRAESAIVVRLTSKPDLDECCSEIIESVYRDLPSEETRFRELLKHLNRNDTVVADEDELADIISELVWLGVIEVTNSERSKRKWSIKRVGL